MSAGKPGHNIRPTNPYPAYRPASEPVTPRTPVTPGEPVFCTDGSRHEAIRREARAALLASVPKLRYRHKMAKTWDEGRFVYWCDGCGQKGWPCDTAAVLALLDPEATDAT